jgi:hypothetical protein
LRVVVALVVVVVVVPVATCGTAAATVAISADKTTLFAEVPLRISEHLIKMNFKVLV